MRKRRGLEYCAMTCVDVRRCSLHSQAAFGSSSSERFAFWWKKELHHEGRGGDEETCNHEEPWLANTTLGADLPPPLSPPFFMPPS